VDKSLGRDQNALEELNRRLAVVRDRVRGVALGHATGFYLFGRPGTSKTYTVKRTLEAEQIKYHYHDGHLTPMGLFELLDEQCDRVILLDDVSSIFKQPIALQLLLAALGNQPDHSGERIIRYRRQGQVDTVHFTGGIIAISNLQLHAHPLLEALKSRVHYLHYDPSDEQIAALMWQVASKGWTCGSHTMEPDECLEVAEFLIGESERLDARLDMRLLVDKGFPDYVQWRSGDTEAHWRDLVVTTLEQRLVDLKHTGTLRLSRTELKEQEHQIIREIVDEFTTRDERVAAWSERTGKSERALYRRLREMGLKE